MSKFIKTLRQYVQYEWNNKTLYKSYPNMNKISSTQAMENLLLKADTEANQMDKFYKLLEIGDDLCYPFAGTIHRYLKKYDTEWYSEWNSDKK